MAEVSPPLWEQNGCTTASMDRQLITGFVCSPGVTRLSAGGLLVSTVSGMSVNVAAGSVFVTANTSTYLATNDATKALTIAAADPSQTRVDLVVATIRDSQYSGVNNDWILQVITGTPGAGQPATPASSMLLATLNIAPAATSVTVTDKRVSYSLCTDALGVTGLLATAVYTAGGTFTIGNYAGAGSIRVRVIGGGGSGSGCVATSGTQITAGPGGAAGGYGEATILASALGANETVTVGAGGTAATAGAGGSTGGNSSFGAWVVANGGVGGGLPGQSVGPFSTSNPAGGTVSGTASPLVSVQGGDGSPGEWSTVSSGSGGFGGQGGSTPMGQGGVRVGTGRVGGNAGRGYGSGSSGSCNGAISQASIGGVAGNTGVVIVEVFA